MRTSPIPHYYIVRGAASHCSRRCFAALIVGLLLNLGLSCFSAAQAQPELSVFITTTGSDADAPVGSAWACDIVTLSFFITNTGTSTATNVVATLALPPNLNVSLITRTGNNSASYNPVTGVVTLSPRATLPSLFQDDSGQANDLTTIIFTMPNSSTAVTASGSVSSTPADLTPGNNSFSFSTQVVIPTADLRTAVTGPASAATGTTVTYTHTTTNGGPQRAYNVVPTLTLVPAPAAGTVSLPSGATYNASTGVVTFASTARLDAAAGSNILSNSISFPMSSALVTVTSNVGSCLRTDNNTPNNSASRTTQRQPPLPVELKAFEVSALGRDAVLNWTTASELRNERFEIERSFDARSFEGVGTERGQGSSTRPTDYRFIDAGAGRQGYPLVYYRLRQVDTDGTASWSPVRVVKFTSFTKATVALHPNPAPGHTTLDLTDLSAGAYQVWILDLMGRQVGADVLAAPSEHPLNIEHLLPGTYVVRVVGQNVNLALSLVRN
ncbi:T9SS type A sorting domain-containing protein [Hymenobacter sp. BT664]|uniref:T9SS type A sorting domain-containing protein n=1 Tax=Hymenobacter montanus TaxID=2771359 RepID=A0A927BCC8_9BACT|nr:T9SS type A sorting domain-containing protein [Hymenobacter montanus]MBD2767477.1 T9SS type A sorting domain-containing protein [Hymenobacter montanus]